MPGAYAARTQRIALREAKSPYTVWIRRHSAEPGTIYHGITYATEPSDFSRRG